MTKITKRQISNEEFWFALEVAINLNLMESFLEKFKMEMEKIRETNEFCESLWFMVDLKIGPSECDVWKIKKATKESLASHELLKEEVDDWLLKHTNELRLPESSLVILFEPKQKYSDEFESKWFEKKLLPITEIVEEIMKKLT